MGKWPLFDYHSDMDHQPKLPSGHQLIDTQDGSFTFYSEKFQEACHSTSGARAETILHYVEGCRIKEKILNIDPLVILEVGFGLGLGFLTTYDELPKDRRWHFLSLELDRNLLEWFQDNHKAHEFLKGAYWDGNLFKAKNEFIELTVIQGDARKTLPEYLKKHPLIWHAIYQDALSPKRNPVLWTKEWFQLLKDHSDSEVILSTYSASSSIRKSLHETGWGVQKGEKFGPKRSSTRAILNAQTDPEILLQLERSPAVALLDLHIDSFNLK